MFRLQDTYRNKQHIQRCLLVIPETYEHVIFRWFKFTLKPPYTITHGNLLLAIWDTSHWTSFVKFGLKTA